MLPASLREADGIRPGEQFEVERVGTAEYRLIRPTPPPNAGVVDWLRASGRAMPIKDSLIAATALTHDLAIATLNRRDFEAAGVALVDPRAGDPN